MNAITITRSATPAAGLTDAARSRLRAEVEALRVCTQKAAALDSLDSIANVIEMPMMAWTPDVARPYSDSEIDEFIRRQGWPEEIVALWRGHNAPARLPFYSRCRYTHLPFVTSLGAPARRDRTIRSTREERLAADISRRLGLRSLLTVPVHLPRGQVAMLTWAGARSPASVKEMLEDVYAELLAVAHFTVRVLHRAGRQPDLEGDEAFRLTPRQWDCLRLTAQGFREADVARLMKIAPTTVRYHIDSAVEKLGASNRTHAVAIAAQLGLLGPIGV